MKNKLPFKDIQIAGYFPGAIGKITELHATYYSDHWGFDVSFESQVGRELSEFMSRFQETRDGLWTCQVNQHFAGSAVIDGQLAESEGARLRWFIVSPEFQGSGIGSVLLDRAVGFCRQVGHKSVFLWTFKGLDAARLLYERFGFRLAEDHLVDQWGNHITEQCFKLTL